MAAVTPSTTARHSMGDLTLTIANFANTTDDADTWASGIEGIVSVMANPAEDATLQSSTGAGASYSGSTVTLHLAEDNAAITLWVLHAS